MLANGGWDLIQRFTLILLTWTIWRAPTNASKWRMGFNSVFKGLNVRRIAGKYMPRQLNDDQKINPISSAPEPARSDQED